MLLRVLEGADSSDKITDFGGLADSVRAAGRFRRIFRTKLLTRADVAHGEHTAGATCRSAAGLSAKLLIVAGEHSGDQYGGMLAAQIQAAKPDLEIHAVGGQRLKEAGAFILKDISDLAVMGITDVVAGLGAIRRAFRTIVDFARREKPDLAVLVDYPDFNIRLAHRLKDLGIPVVYFVGPTVWAWRRGRVRKIARSVRKMLVILPFEESIYRSAGVDVEFVGHPLLEIPEPVISREELRAELDLKEQTPLVAVLPGSRSAEIQRILPALREAIPQIRKRTGAQFLLPIAENLDRREVECALEGVTGVFLLEGRAREVLRHCDVAVVKSGTSTIEATLAGAPMVVVYRTTALTYWVGRLLVRVRDIGMVNIVAGRRIVPELVQSDLTPEAVSGHVIRLIEDESLRESMRRDLKEVKDKLAGGGGTRRAAEVILDLVTGSKLASGADRP